MKVTNLFPTMTFKLILEFDYQEYRLLDIKRFLENDKGKLAEIRDDIHMFRTVKIDKNAGTAYWENGVDFDPHDLYKTSISLAHILNYDD